MPHTFPLLPGKLQSWELELGEKGSGGGGCSFQVLIPRGHWDQGKRPQLLLCWARAHFSLLRVALGPAPFLCQHLKEEETVGLKYGVQAPRPMS